MANDDVASKKAELDSVYADLERQLAEDMARVLRGEPLPPGDRGARAWAVDAEPFFGLNRTGPTRFDRPEPPEPARSLWRRLRDAWAGMVAGWRGEAWWQE